MYLESRRWQPGEGAGWRWPPEKVNDGESSSRGDRPDTRYMSCFRITKKDRFLRLVKSYERNGWLGASNGRFDFHPWLMVGLPILETYKDSHSFYHKYMVVPLSRFTFTWVTSPLRWTMLAFAVAVPVNLGEVQLILHMRQEESVFFSWRNPGWWGYADVSHLSLDLTRIEIRYKVTTVNGTGMSKKKRNLIDWTRLGEIRC